MELTIILLKQEKRNWIFLLNAYAKKIVNNASSSICFQRQDITTLYSKLCIKI